MEFKFSTIDQHDENNPYVKNLPPEDSKEEKFEVNQYGVKVRVSKKQEPKDGEDFQFSSNIG
jgi:hypothetical protein